MAKIIVLINKVNFSKPQNAEDILNREFVSQLAENQNDVKVITLQNSLESSEINLHKNIEVIRPWKKWSIFSFLKGAQVLLPYDPDIVHAVTDSIAGNSAFLNSAGQIAQLSKLANQSISALSIYNVSQKNSANRSLGLFDVIFTASENDQRFLKSSSLVPGAQKISSLPALTLDSTFECELPVADKNWFLLPGSPKDHPSLPALLTASESLDCRFVFTGGWGEMSVLEKRDFLNELRQRHAVGKFIITNEALPLIPKNWIVNSRGIITSTMSSSSLTLTLALQAGQQNHQLVILSPIQAHGDARNWIHQENGLIAETHPESLATSLKVALEEKKLCKKIRENLAASPETQKAESGINFISRIYKQAAIRPN